MRRRIHSPLSNFFSSRASKPQQHQRQQRAIQAHGLLRSTALRADDKPQADHGPAPTLQPSVAMNYYYQPGYSHVPPAAMQQQNGPPRWTVPPAGPLHPLPHHHRDPSAQVQQQQQQQHQQQRHQQQRHQQQRHQQQRHQQQRHQQQRHQQQRHQQQQEQNPQHPPPTATTLPQGPLAQIPGLTLLHARSQPDPRSNAPLCPSPAVRVQPAKKGIKRKSARPGSKTNPPAATQNGTKLIASVVSEPSTSARNDPKEGRQVPSRESGGVPEPTPLYLARSFAPPATLPQPRRILVILDLNGTVLYRPTRRQPTTFIERPHARRFLAYCLEAFHLAVWSSARPDNVQHMLTQLLTRDQRERCVVTWARDRLGLSQDDYDSRVQCYKRLATVWNNEKVQASHPAADRGGCWDQSNTVLVDDSREKGRSEPHNILAVPEFSGLQNERADVLPQVHDYLNVLCHQQDISRYMRQSPFELDPSYQLFTSPPTGT